MPYTPVDRTSRAWATGSLSWQTIPPYSTFRLPYTFTPVNTPDPVANEIYDQMIDPALGTWNAGRFTPARAGRHRFAAQFLVYKQEGQGQVVDVFFRIEVVRAGVSTVIAAHDALHHLIETGELARPLTVEATPHLLPSDQVQVRFGLIEGELMSIVTGDPTRTFCDITAYWS